MAIELVQRTSRNEGLEHPLIAQPQVYALAAFVQGFVRLARLSSGDYRLDRTAAHVLHRTETEPYLLVGGDRELPSGFIDRGWQDLDAEFPCLTDVAHDLVGVADF